MRELLDFGSFPVNEKQTNEPEPEHHASEQDEQRPARTWTTGDPELSQILKRFAGKLCPSWFGKEHREEVCQEVLFRLVRDESSAGEQREYNASYLWKTVSFVRNEKARRIGKRTRREIPMDDSETSPVDVPTHQDPERLWRSSERGREIRDCLKHLAADPRRAVILWLQGYTVPEIAKSFGWGEKAAENRVYRGRARLRDCLEKKGIRPKTGT